ncbi:CMGC family protein kinase [Histomonas meleagridis]|uniref:CMGC family protein kinase n=1 Tax=Histomonas meleagridis TaxID=135588 RepID=UPI00355A088C|nr:CMGC family protein kinase [Histomonas meleagridis]KAH0804039.1 CMGC family protein kinase [Histomonas meleagridis]
MNNINIVGLRGIERNPIDQSIYLVLDYCEYDLAGLIHRNALSFEHKLDFIKQLLNGVYSMHKLGYVHRDIKPSNIMVTKDNIIKLGDPGLARKLDQQNRPLTPKVVTPSYRAPELILGDPYYDQAVDVWSLGCVIYEIITGKVLFKPSTSSDISQLDSIFRICGSPTVDNWPSFQQLPKAEYASMMRLYDSRLEEFLQNTLPPEFLGIKDLIKSMLHLDPKNRITVEEALSYPLLTYETLELPQIPIPECHAMDTQFKPLNAIKVSRPITRPPRIVPPCIYA